MSQAFQRADLSFSLSEDQTIMLHWNPVDSSTPVSREDVLTAMEAAGYGHYQVDQKALDFFVFSQQRLGRQARQICIARQVKPEITVAVASDHLKAWLTVTRVPGFSAPPLEAIETALQQKKVVFGVLQDVLEQYLQQGYLEQTVIAQGEAPQPGRSAWFEYLIADTQLSEDELYAQERVDFRQRNTILTVSEGQLLMRKHPAEKGRPGKSVLGEILPAEDGRDYALNASTGSLIHPEDDNLLLASRDGRPICLTRSVRVDNVLTVEEVNYDTGHINFKGSVIIKGTVADGFQVRATGDIVVYGSVEDAILEADNDIRIQGSMFGRERARLSAGGNIYLNYIQSTEIDCMGDLHVHDGLFHCQVRALGEIIAGENDGKGRINGGEIWGGKRIVARVVGSNSSTTTRLSLGEDPYLRQKLRDIDHNLRFYKSELEQVVKSIIYIRTRAAEKTTSLSELEERRSELLETVNLLSEQVQEVRDNLNRSRFHCELIVKEAIMSGSRIRLAEKSRPIDEDMPACRFYLQPDDNGLQVRADIL